MDAPLLSPSPRVARVLVLLGLALGACAARDAASDTVEPHDVDAVEIVADTSERDGDDISSLDTAPPARRCNGYAALCDRRLDEIVFPATHNSMSSADDGWLGPNQTHDVPQQLADGVRALLIDTHAWNGGAYLCHAVCEFGHQPLAEALGEIRAFLDAHPDELIVLVIEDALGKEPTLAAFAESGLDAYALELTPGERPPVLADALDAGTRVLVTFQSAGPPPGWYHNVWDYTFDTPYSFASADELSCACNRGCDGRATKPFFLLNHFITRAIGSIDDAEEVNRRDVLLTRARACEAALGHLPNLVAVDFYEVGDLFDVVAALNGVEGAATTSP
ncbi:MAG: hypothetical protein EP329_00745 [Deltaproteobacteria bacterium]|nr:MAG: hypothetical protein EP329_00745 [Deltaproteobacteria bacterium]